MKTWMWTTLVALLIPAVATAQTGASQEAQNKGVVLKMIELVNTHQVERLGEVFDADFEDHGPSAGAGLEGLKKGLALMHGAFPDQHFAVEEIMAERDKVAIRGTLSATFTGSPLFNVPATGNHAEWLTLMTFRLADGKIVERWTNADTWGMLQQIGVLPSAEWDMSSLVMDTPGETKQEKKNKKAARRLVENVWIDRKLDSVEKFFAADGGLSGGVPAGAGRILNPEVIKMVGSAVFEAFPDFEASIDFVIAEGDNVVLRISETGTHRSDYMGVPASGKKVSWSDTFFLTFRDGKIVQAWMQADTMGLMRQVGGFKPQATGKAQPGMAGMTPAERNRAVFTRFIEEFWNQRNFEVADEIIAPEHFSSSIPMLPKGPEGMKLIAGIVAGSIFPDLQRRVIEVFATEDMVGAIWENSGTHEGVYMNVPGTGKKVKWLELGIIKMKDGKFVESWYRPDEVGLLKELTPEKLEWLHF